ncbi:sigma-70 family RNA polymerase sigma factor [Actinoplanes sp. NEAU-A12]|uniref:Sigma-70 family RNA polymerase sigma factor n=1 Tax=Actinoplanes sandaracinus TaxID=3045177 RepID=A0ABT6WGY4_9ACTN|nr:sigma-70 family RNA polymerase sigma factor [Actinoplanes sandaracinus]MDI6098989.1 sigma-70 family RNA polymerase sigma factor [Actinoplanes sandaracinus]
MRALDTDVAAAVTAAQRGDRQALAGLVTTYLPLVYNVVGRAIDNSADVDDVVQDTMLRAVRDLPALRAPASFPTWLAAIAVRQVGTHRHRQQTAVARTTGLDQAVGRPDPAAHLEGVSLLETELTAQRREVAEASRWLDPDDRLLLAFWWQEVAGLMSRGEVAAAMGLGVAHTGVRLQRMREHIDVARAVVAALGARPACPQLTGLVSGWDGRPGRLWRKRLARHVRACPICSSAALERLPVERLLAGLPAIAVPAGFTEQVLSQTTALPSQVLSPAPAATEPVAAPATVASAGMTAVAAVTGLAVATAVVVGLPGAHEPRTPQPVTAPAATTAPPPASPAPARITPGRLSLEWAGGGYLTARDDDVATVAAVGDQDRRKATFVAVAGLGDPACFSFQTLDGRYLRHYELLAYTHDPNDTGIFRQDATYCPEPGVTADSVMLRSHNYPDFYLRWTGSELRIGHFDDSSGFRTDSSFRIRPAPGG